MKALIWNTLDQTLPGIVRSSRQTLFKPQSSLNFSTSSSLFAPGRDFVARRQREIDVLKTAAAPGKDSGKDSGGVAGILNLLNARTDAAGKTNATFIDGLRARQENSIPAYGNRTPPYNLHVYAHKHNTIITLTRPNGNPIMSLGCGNIGFRKSHRSGYDPAYQLSSHVFAQIQERGLLHEINNIALVLRGFGMGRDAFIKVLLGNEGRNIRPLVSRVTDATRIKFGGTRSRHVRRLG